MPSRAILAERSILLAFAPAHLLSGHPSKFVRGGRFIGTEHNIRVRVILMEKVSAAIWQQKRHFRDSVSVYSPLMDPKMKFYTSETEVSNSPLRYYNYNKFLLGDSLTKFLCAVYYSVLTV